MPIQEQFEVQIPASQHHLILDMLLTTTNFAQLLDIIDQETLDKFKRVRIIIQKNTIPELQDKKIIYILEDN